MDGEREFGELEDPPAWVGPLAEPNPKDFLFYWNPTGEEPARLGSGGWLPPRLSSGGWVRAERGGLTQPIYARIALKGGRPRVIGLLVDNDLEVTADLLRSIRVGALLEQFLDDFEESGPNLAGVRLKEYQIVEEEWLLMRHFLAEAKPATDSQPPIRARKGRPPSDEALRRFADVHRRNLATHPRRAMSQTARDMHMARTTAYRWLEMCLDRGLLEKNP